MPLTLRRTTIAGGSQERAWGSASEAKDGESKEPCSRREPRTANVDLPVSIPGGAKALARGVLE